MSQIVRNLLQSYKVPEIQKRLNNGCFETFGGKNQNATFYINISLTIINLIINNISGIC